MAPHQGQWLLHNISPVWLEFLFSLVIHCVDYSKRKYFNAEWMHELCGEFSCQVYIQYIVHTMSPTVECSQQDGKNSWRASLCTWKKSSSSQETFIQCRNYSTSTSSSPFQGQCSLWNRKPWSKKDWTQSFLTQTEQRKQRTACFLA